MGSPSSAPRRLQAVPDGVLAALLRDRRQKLAVTQAIAATRIGASQQLVANWESGSRPSNRYLPGIATFLGLNSVDALHATLSDASKSSSTAARAESALDRLINSVAVRFERGEALSVEETRMVNNLVDSYRWESESSEGR